jgi:transcription initiation factor IIF auxiliary subunit
MRGWTIKLYMVDDQGNEQPADCFNKVTYNLHPSFENPIQSELYTTFMTPRPAESWPAQMRNAF